MGSTVYRLSELEHALADLEGGEGPITRLPVLELDEVDGLEAIDTDVDGAGESRTRIWIAPTEGLPPARERAPSSVHPRLTSARPRLARPSRPEPSEDLSATAPSQSPFADVMSGTKTSPAIVLRGDLIPNLAKTTPNNAGGHAAGSSENLERPGTPHSRMRPDRRPRKRGTRGRFRTTSKAALVTGSNPPLVAATGPVSMRPMLDGRVGTACPKTLLADSVPSSSKQVSPGVHPAWTPVSDDGELAVGDNTAVLKPGLMMGNYQILRPIAKGGMGVVYEAKHQYLERRVAVKVLRDSRRSKPNSSLRFINEAVAATRIGHPGVVEVIDYGHTQDGAAYLVMEYLDGDNLADRIERCLRIPLPEALRYGGLLADALSAAHAAGIVHRDLKPENILLVNGDDGDQPKVLDFGVAKFLEGGSRLNKTRYGKLLGTPYYMSPEQCEGALEVDHRSDVYSLGCVIFEMLTGRPPFRGQTADVLSAHRWAEPPRLSDLASDAPPAVEALISQMLAKSPDARPQSMAQVVAELSLVANGSQAIPRTVGGGAVPFESPKAAVERGQFQRADRARPRPPAGRRKLLRGALFLVLMFLGALAAAYLVMSNAAG